MTSLSASNQTMRRASLLLPVSTLLLVAVAPRHVQWSTYAVFIALAIGTSAVMWTTWRHAQAVASLRQELYEINHPAAGVTGSSWQQWLAAGDRSDARGRAQATFALSVAITAVIVYAWFA